MEKSELQMKTLYDRAAVNGFYFGLYLVALFFVNAYTQALPILSIVGLAMMVAVPVLVYRWLASSYRVSRLKASYSELWLEGIMMFFFATLIVSVVSVVYMLWIHPGWLVEQMTTAIEQARASELPQLEEMASVLSDAMKERVLPTPIQLTLDMGWLIMFTGSVLSMCMAALVRSRIKETK